MQVQSNKLNFEGQNIFVGIDVHKKDWTVCIFSEHFANYAKIVVEFVGIATIKLYDMLGKEVLSQTANGKSEININYLPNGVYSVHILSEDRIVGSSKIVKQ